MERISVVSEFKVNLKSCMKSELTFEIKSSIMQQTGGVTVTAVTHLQQASLLTETWRVL